MITAISGQQHQPRACLQVLSKDSHSDTDVQAVELCLHWTEHHDEREKLERTIPTPRRG